MRRLYITMRPTPSGDHGVMSAKDSLMTDKYRCEQRNIRQLDDNTLLGWTIHAVEFGVLCGDNWVPPILGGSMRRSESFLRERNAVGLLSIDNLWLVNIAGNSKQTCNQAA